MDSRSRNRALVVWGGVTIAGYACSGETAPDRPPATTSGLAAGSNAPPGPTVSATDTSQVVTTPEESSSLVATDGPSPSSSVPSNPDTWSDGAPSETSTKGAPIGEGTSAAASRENSSSHDVPATSSSPVDVPSGTCTPSELTRSDARGTGPYGVVIETNSDPGINEGTIFRPAELGGAEKYPIFVWGQGACSKNGLSNASAMTEIASHGYFVVADGTPNGSGSREMDRSKLAAMGAPLMAYVDWAIAENDKPCSVYYQSLDTAKVASNGFSCGGLMAQGTVLDPRIVTWGVTSSGMAGADEAFYRAIHTPVLFVEGGAEEVAYEGALQGYNRISELAVPVMWFDKALGHGGDLLQPDGGDFTRINLAWLNWWLKGDEGMAGKSLLVGGSCPYCSDGSWDVRSSNIP